MMTLKPIFPLALALGCLNYASAADQWYDKAEHGPAFAQTFGDWFKGEYRPDSGLKSILLTYADGKEKVALFNTETLTLVSAADQWVSLDNTPWGGKHGEQNKFRNKDSFLFATASGPGWADAKGSFEDQREIKDHGNLSYARFKGYFRNGEKIILDYSVHETRILDHVSDVENGLVRTLEVAPHDKELTARLADDAKSDSFNISVSGSGAKVTEKDGTWYLRLDPAKETQLVSILYSTGKDAKAPEATALSPLLKGGEGISPETFKVTGQMEEDPKATWAVDQVPLPDILKKEPYFANLRTSDFDFFSDGDRALLSTWDGDIWLVTGLKEFKEITWKRYATGFFEPLGLRIVDDIPYVGGRDAIWKLHDLNGDDEADHFEIFNNDVLITNNFHEFQFGLETDADGNFYIAKASPVRPGGRGFDKILPHNGAVMRISPDGYKLEVIATGLRAPGGIGIGPEGQITTGENEGTWQPACKLNYFFPKKGEAFFGTEDSRHGVETKFTEPLMYFPMDIDNSGGGQVWVPDFAKFGLKTGELIHMSYGQSTLFRILPQELSDISVQGGAVKIPVKLSSSAQRAAFHPDGSLYVCGFRGWQTNAAKEAGFQRIRYVEANPILIPGSLKVTEKGIEIGFEVALDKELAEDPASYQIERWKYIRSSEYGSGQFSIDNPDVAAQEAALKKASKNVRNRDTVKVTGAKLMEDGKTVLITIEDLKPAQQMKIAYDLESADGEAMIGEIHNTVHKVE